MVELPTYCVLNYQSEEGVDKLNSSNFWFTSSLIRVIGDKPFGRGDIAKIIEVKHPTETEWCIYCEIIGDPELDEIPDEVYAEGEVPTFIFVTTKIYTNVASEYEFFSSDNVKVLLACSAVMNDNKSYTAAVLIKGKQGKVQAVDKLTGTEMEWVITDGVK
jgi:hypothetical protein